VMVALELLQDRTELGELCGERGEHAAVFARMVPCHG
jgi:hypothetical protein